MKKLYRSDQDKILGGVCGGIADSYNLDPTLVRLLVAILVLSSAGTGLLVYLIAWFIMPKKSDLDSLSTKSDGESDKDDEDEEDLEEVEIEG